MSELVMMIDGLNLKLDECFERLEKYKKLYDKTHNKNYLVLISSVNMQIIRTIDEIEKAL